MRPLRSTRQRMTITAICLLKLPSLPLPDQGPVRAEALEDCVLLHTSLDFADDPLDVAGAIRSLLGEPLATQHADARGVYLIPSVAAPRARAYDAVLDEVGEGGVWATWEPPARPAAPSGDLAGMLGSMLGQMPESMFAAAAAGLRDNPAALKEATAQLPGLLEQPGALGALLEQGSSQMPELAGMLRALGLDLADGDLTLLTSSLQAELGRDPASLLAMAESLFGGTDDEDDQDDQDEPGDPADQDAKV